MKICISRSGYASMAGVVAAFGLILLPLNDASACGGRPPPPSCGKTLAVALAVPDTLLLPNGGGSFDVSTLLYFNMTDNPPGAGICPNDLVSAKVTVTADCDGDLLGDGDGMTDGIPVAVGDYTPATVTVTVPNGPPRQCELWAEATIALSDGMTLTNDSHSMACIGEPSPGDPALPRLDLVMIDRDGAERARVHPGSQAGYCYRLINNDDDQAFSGTVMVESKNASRMPTATGPMPQGTGPFPISDPGDGDNFPVSFPEGLDETGCVILPPDPVAQVESTDTMNIDNLGPGESTDVHFFTRPWGMCANGSCGNIKVIAEGTFDGPEPGFACAGVVIAADTLAPPGFFWNDSGRTVTIAPAEEFPGVNLDGEIFPGQDAHIPIEIVALELSSTEPIGIDAVPHIAPFSNQRGEHTRMELQIFGPNPLFTADQPITIDATFNTALPPSSPIQTELVSMELTGPLATDSPNLGPAVDGHVILSGESTGVDSFFDIFHQISAVGIDDLGVWRELDIDEFLVTIIENSQYRLELTGTVAPGDSNNIQQLLFRNDFRGFSGSREVLFSDGAERTLDFGVDSVLEIPAVP